MSWEVGTPIPDDWSEEVDGYAVGLLLFPNSDKWGLVLRTVLRVLSRGRFWRRESGVITDAQDAGRLAYMSFTYVSFSELLGAVGGVRDAVEALKLQTQVNVACCDQLTPPDPPVPPPEELPPPGSDPGDVPPAYGGDAGAYDAELCRSANALHWLVRRYLVALTRLDTVGGAIAIAVALLAIVFPEGASTVIGGVSLAAIVAALVLIEGGLETVAAWAEDAIVYWDSIQQEIVCALYLRIGAAENWKDGVSGEIVAQLQAVVSAAPMPDSAIATAVDWLAALLDWLERDIYDGLATLESHPEPLACAGCGECACGDCYDGLAACLEPDEALLSPGSVVNVYVGGADDWEYTYSYDSATGIIEIDATTSGHTVFSAPMLKFDFATSAGQERVTRVVEVLDYVEGASNNRPIYLEDLLMDISAPFVFAGCELSSNRGCIDSALDALATPRARNTDGDVYELSFSTQRPGDGESVSFYARIRFCVGERPV